MKHHPLKILFTWLRKQSPEQDHLPLCLKFDWGQSFPQFQDLSSLWKVSFAGSHRPFPLIVLFKYVIPYIKLTVNFPNIPLECFTHSPIGILAGFCHAIWQKFHDIYIGECILRTNYHKVKYYVTKKTTRCIWKHLYVMLIRNPIPFYSN